MAAPTVLATTGLMRQACRVAEEVPRPRVLLARVSASPLAAVGMQSMLAEAGMEIVALEDRRLAIVSRVRELRPDAVVLALKARGAETLCGRIRAAAPKVTVFVWAADEPHQVQTMAAGDGIVHHVVGAGCADLHRAWLASQIATVKE
jgi:AmiR/NasT family two-component response regulator